MHEQRSEWEFIFLAQGSKSDPTAVEAYLADIFGSTSMAKKMVKTPLGCLRETMGSFRLETLDSAILKVCITGILETDLISEAKAKNTG